MQFFNTAACVLLLTSGVAINALPITDQAAALSPRAGTLQNPWIGKGWPKYPDIFTKDQKTLKKTHDLIFGKPKAPNPPPLKVDGPVKAPTPVKGPALFPRAGTLQNPWVGKGWKYPDVFTKNPETLKKLQNIIWGKPKDPKIAPLKTDGPPKAPTPVKGP